MDHTRALRRLAELEAAAAESPQRARELRHKLRHAREAVAPRSHLTTQRTVRVGGVEGRRRELEALEAAAAESPQRTRELRHKLRHARDRLRAAEAAD